MNRKREDQQGSGNECRNADEGQRRKKRRPVPPGVLPTRSERPETDASQRGNQKGSGSQRCRNWQAVSEDLIHGPVPIPQRKAQVPLKEAAEIRPVLLPPRS